MGKKPAPCGYCGSKNVFVHSHARLAGAAVQKRLCFGAAIAREGRHSCKGGNPWIFTLS